VIIAVMFGLFMLLRFYNAEEIARSSVRAYFRAEGVYTSRRTVQAPLVALLLVIVAAAAFALMYRWSRIVRGRRNVARVVAVVAVLAMLLLIALRLASLHAIDALLYGPLKFNWIIDIGASLTVMGAAAYYVKLVRERP
jgi:drug/metabolite transporter (DMT)-like permease